MLSAGLLGYVCYAQVDSRVFQAYESRKLDQALKNVSAGHQIAGVTPPATLPGDEGASTSLAQGDVVGRIEISRLNIAVIILEGTSGKTLRHAVGHITGTSLPGATGNVGIAGHRDTFFRGLRDIRNDDQITLTTVAGSYRYKVDSIRIVDPENVEVLKDSGESVVTLVTCYPFDFVGPAPKRFIVRAHRE